MKIAISSGHGKFIRGASGYLDEVDEARRVVETTATYLRDAGALVDTFHDNVSDDQSENLDRIVDWHNSATRDLDISVHFNAYNTTDKGMGTECLYLTQKDLATKVSAAIAKASGLINRGPKKRSDLYFLNKTDDPAILIEVAFVDSKTDQQIYDKCFEPICAAIASTIAGLEVNDIPTGLNELLTIDGVTIFEKDNGQYIRFVSDLDVCNDGSGPSHGDPSYQSQTAYYSGGVDGGKYLNADMDKYIVIPPQIRKMVPPIVMGCKGRMTNLKTGAIEDGVIGEIGPDYTTGEAAYKLSKIINPAITYNSGDKKKNYLYELWPGQAAIVDGFRYKLQPA